MDERVVGDDANPVDLDAVDGGVDPSTQDRPLPVDPDAALENEFLGPAPGREPGPR